MTIKPDPTREDLEFYVLTQSITKAAIHFYGYPSANKKIRFLCELYKIPIKPIIKRQSRNHRPSKNKFVEVLHKYSTIREIAEHYGVTITTIYNWMRTYGVKR